MGIRLNTNVASLNTQRFLSSTVNEGAEIEEKLSSGNGINRAADNAAGLGISEKLKARIKGLGQAERNANDGISLLQVAEGGLSESANLLVRLRELSVQAANDSLASNERQIVNKEYHQLKQEIDRIAKSTEFNGQKLINGQGASFLCQIGYNNNDNVDRIMYNASRQNSTIDALGISDINVDSKLGAQQSLSKLDQAIDNVSWQRADLGALQNRLTSTVYNIQNSVENLSSANSRIRDVDMAQATAKKTRNDILNSIGTSVLTQVNNQGASALKLIG